MFSKRLIMAVTIGCLGVSSLAWAGNVYVVVNEARYHRPTCPLVYQIESTEMDEVQAKQQNYKACKKCRPDKPEDDQQ